MYQLKNPEIYGNDLLSEVIRYSHQVGSIAEKEDYDIIHCHDWLTFPAGIRVKKVAERRGKNVPLIAHVHSTEFDRTAGFPNQVIYNIERECMHKADYIITVSNYTKNIVERNYGVNPEKIFVVYNSIDTNPDINQNNDRVGEELGTRKFLQNKNFVLQDKAILYPTVKKYHKTVLFLGRITIQKGPDHFLWIAKKIAEVDDNVMFIMAGSGDMFSFIVEEAAKKEIDRAYEMADVYVMPSVSEPFGITTLEAMKNRTPVVVSKQSGVSEVVRNCLVADFWDTDEMANTILSILYNDELKKELRKNGLDEIRTFSWNEPARKCIELYKKALN